MLKKLFFFLFLTAGYIYTFGQNSILFMPIWQQGETHTFSISEIKVKVKIEIIDGKPILSWEPDLNENGTKDLRIYKTYGAKNLGGSDEWTDMDEVSESEKELFNFFCNLN